MAATVLRDRFCEGVLRGSSNAFSGINISPQMNGILV
jgi:hypothetical protein